MKTSIGVVVIATGLTFACGSGGPDATSSSSSGASGSSSSGGSSSSSSSSGSTSSSSSSGEVQCGATCQSQATITFDEPNGSGQLDGAIVDACRKSACVRGKLTKPDGGTTYTLQLSSINDAGPLGVYATVSPAPAAGSLRFVFTWSLEYSGTNAPADGDTFSVSARVSEDGIELFTHDYTATYKTVTVCGTVCKDFQTGP